MEDILEAKTRSVTGKKVRKLREQGMLPSVLYGHEIKTQPLQVKEHDFEKIFKKVGFSSLVDLQIDKNPPVKILIHHLQKDPISDKPLHADFYKVKMTEKIKTQIPLHFVGEAPAVKQLDGNLITNKDSLEVECLPDDLVGSIEVDISSLKTFEDKIKVSNLKVPEKITVLDDKEEIVALVEEPRSEEELKELEEEVKEEEEVEKVEEVEKKPEEEEEKAEEKPTEEPEKIPESMEDKSKIQSSNIK